MIAPQPHNTKDKGNFVGICINITVTESLAIGNEQVANGEGEGSLLKSQLPLLKRAHLYWIFLGTKEY